MPDERVDIVIEGQDKLSPAAKSANASLAKLEGQAKRASSTMGHMHGSASSAATGMAKADMAAATLVGRLGGLGSALEHTGMKMQMSGMMLSMTFTAPLMALGGLALKTAADYEQSMNILQAVTGATADEMAQMDRLAIQLGADLTLPATSASDAGEAMTELAKAGLSVNDVMGAAKGVLQLAAAGQLSEARAAEITANALNAFKLPGIEAVRIADLLAASANVSSAEVEDMAMAMQMAAAVFASAKMPIEDLITGLGIMANAGIKNSDAGTSMKQMLLQLETPTKKARELMGSYGIAIYDAAGNMKPLRDLVGTFSEKLKDATQEQRDFVLGTVLGSDAIRAANILLMGGVEVFDKMAEAVTKEAAAAKLAEARTKGLNGVVDGLKSQVETFLLTAGNPMIKNLEGVAWIAVNLTGKLAALDPKVIDVAVAFGAALAIIGPLKLVIGGMAMMLGSLASPLGLVVLATGAMAAAWATNLGNIQSKTEAIVGRVTRAFDRIGDSLGGSIRDAFYWGLDFISNFAEGIIDGATSILASAADMVAGFLEYWFAPGSPPRVAPDIDQWGAATMEEWIKGFNDADFGAFRSLASVIEGQLRNMVKIGQLSEEGLIPALIGRKAVLAEAITQMETIGIISEGLMSQLTEGFGRAGDAVKNYLLAEMSIIPASKAVEEAQKRVEETERRLRDIRRERVGKGQEEGHRQAVDAAQREVDLARDALDVARDQESSLKKQANLAKMVVGEMSENRNLQGQLADSMERAAKAAEQAAKATGGIAGGLTQATKDLPGKMQEAVDKVKENVTKGITDGIDNAMMRVKEKLSPLGEAAAAVGDGIKALGFDASSFGRIAGAIGAIVSMALVAKVALGGLFAAFALLTSSIGLIVTGLTALALVLSGNLKFEDVKVKVLELRDAFTEWVDQALPVLLEKLGELAQKMFDLVVENAPKLAAQLGEWAKAFIDWVGPMLPALGRWLIRILNAVLMFVVTNAPVLLRKLLDEWVPAFIGWVLDAAIKIAPYLNEFLIVINTWIITTAIPKLIETAFSLGSIIGEKARDGLFFWQPAIKTFFDWLGGLIDSARENISKMNIGQHGEIPTEGLGRRAIGGPVAAMQPYLVGEHGPELFIPRTAGNVVSNQNLRNDDNRRVTVNVYANNADDVTDRFAADPRVRDYLKPRPRW